MNRTRALVVALLVAAFAAGGAFAQADLKAQAEEAFRNDFYPEAIALYEKIVAADPNDAFSLKRLGLLYSWDNRLEESIGAYRRALALDPKDEDAKRELAKINSWAGHNAEAEAGYSELIKAHPDDATLKLDLARILGWQGRFEEARAIYEPLIAAKDHPIEAAVGMGDISAWKGDLLEAERWYRQVLKADPANEAALIGLARVHHWQGKDRDAVREIDQATERFPKSREAKKAQQEIHDPLRPYVSPYWNRVIDTDSNDVIESRLTGGFHLDPQMTLDFAYSHFDARFRCETASQCVGIDPLSIPEEAEDEGDRFETRYATRLSDILFLNASLGAARQEGFSGNELTQLIGSGSFDLYVARNVGFGFGLSRQALFDTARIIDNHIRLGAADARIDWHFAERWRLRAGMQHAWFSDDNQRNVINVNVSVLLPVQRPRLSLAYALRYLTYQDDEQDQLDNGYFAPTKFLSNLLVANISDNLFHRRFYYSVELTGGVQSFDRLLCTSDPNPDPAACPTDPEALDAGTDTVFGYELMGGWNIHRNVVFEAYYGSSDYAQQVASGFESHHYGYLFRFSF